MKLASLKSGRDGRLVVVSKDLTRAADARAIAPTLQAALDDWAATAPKLEELAADVEAGRAETFAFNQEECASPLPRAFQWADASAYVNHVALVRQARNAEVPASFWTDPLMYQGGSDAFLGPRDDIPCESEEWGIDLEGEVAVITGDVPAAASREACAKAIKLVMLVNDVSLRNRIPGELAKGFGFFQSKPPTAFSPVAVTPDELGDKWDGGKLHLPLVVEINGKLFGKAVAGDDMTFDFPRIIQHASETRPMVAGSIVGSGTVSNRDPDGGPGSSIEEGGLGYACIAEIRTVETIRTGKPKTSFLRFGDRVRIDMRDAQGHSIFGTIDQKVVKYNKPA